MTVDETSGSSPEKRSGSGPATHAVSRKETIPSPPFDAPAGLAGDPGLSEDLALALLKRPDIPAEALEALGKNSAALQHRKVRLALASHPKTPRHVSLLLLRHLYTFELMQVALTPVVPADVKKVADEALINRLETISAGEKLSLARRASGSVAGALLVDQDARVMRAALENSRLTEAAVVRSLTALDTTDALVDAVCHHPKWSLRKEVRIALLRNGQIPVARALEFSRSLSLALLQEVLQNSRLPAETKAWLLSERAGASGGQ